MTPIHVVQAIRFNLPNLLKIDTHTMILGKNYFWGSAPEAPERSPQVGTFFNNVIQFSILDLLKVHTNHHAYEKKYFQIFKPLGVRGTPRGKKT